MKIIKPSINIKYIIECCKKESWEYECGYSLIQEAIDEIEKLRKFFPNAKFRLVRSEWQVIE